MPSNPNLREDFLLVSTWWQWSAEDIAFFQGWSHINRDEAAAWIHAEATKVRRYRDHMGISCIQEFIREQ